MRTVYKVGNNLSLFSEDIYSTENLSGRKQCVTVIIVYILLHDSNGVGSYVCVYLSLNTSPPGG